MFLLIIKYISTIFLVKETPQNTLQNRSKLYKSKETLDF